MRRSAPSTVTTHHSSSWPSPRPCSPGSSISYLLACVSTCLLVVLVLCLAEAASDTPPGGSYRGLEPALVSNGSCTCEQLHVELLVGPCRALGGEVLGA